MNLPVENHGIDDHAAVIDQTKIFKRRRPGFPIDSDQRQVRAETPRFAPRIEESSLLKTWFCARRGIFPRLAGGGNLSPGYSFVGHLGYRETTIRQGSMVFGCRLHQVPSDTPRLFDDAIDSNNQGAATNDGATTAKGPDALLDHQRVAVSNRHVIHGNADLLRCNLGKDGLMALAVGAYNAQSTVMSPLRSTRT